jgi:hypothetical protein
MLRLNRGPGLLVNERAFYEVRRSRVAGPGAAIHATGWVRGLIDFLWWYSRARQVGGQTCPYRDKCRLGS